MSETLRALSDSLAALVQAAGASIVRVEARDRMPASGVVYSADGLIVTANHIVERDESITLGLADGSSVAATLVGRDENTDLAVLRAASGQFQPAAWTATSDLKVGHLVLALGRPGRTVQATQGIISALGGEWRTPAGGRVDRYLQTDVAMYPGFSGGPLVTVDGSFAGLNTSGVLRGVSIAIPADTIKAVVATLVAHGKVPRGYLGVGIQPVRLADALQTELGQSAGLMVMSVEPDSPAASAGILQGDILIAVDGTSVHQIDSLQAVLQDGRVGKTTPIKLVRSNTLMTLDATIGQAG